MPKETKGAVRSFIVSLCLREAVGSGARGAFAGRAKGTWKLLGALEKQHERHLPHVDPIRGKEALRVLTASEPWYQTPEPIRAETSCWRKSRYFDFRGAP